MTCPVKACTVKELVLILASKLVNICLVDTVYTSNHICSITFDSSNMIFILRSLTSDHIGELSFDECILLLEKGKFKNLDLIDKTEVSKLVQTLSGANVSHGKTDYITQLIYNKNNCTFVAQFGSLVIKIPMIEARELMKRKELPTITLLS